MLGQVHGNLPRVNDGTRVVLGLDLHQPQPELLGHHFLDGFDGDLPGLGINEIFEYLLSIGEGNLGADQRRMRHQADQCTF